MDILKTFEYDTDKRVNVFHDMDCDRPFDAYGPPVISVSFTPNNRYAHNLSLSDEKYRDYIANFVSQHGNDWNLLERALKIVFDAKFVETFETRDAIYFVFDPKEEFPGYADHIRKNVVKGYATEYESWINGECYGLMFEKRVTGQKIYSDGRAEEFEEWEETNTVGGFIGDFILDEKSLQSAVRDYEGFDTDSV